MGSPSLPAHHPTRTFAGSAAPSFVRFPARGFNLASLLLFLLLPLLLLLSLAGEAWAGGPRFVTGPSFYATQPGLPIAFRISNPLYYTDTGALSAAVTHAQAESMVAAAAATWNIPTASLTLAQGGALAEHVSAANVSSSRGGLVVPADVDPSNYLSKPIAVIYDTDGSVTDLLLGSGASDPLGCRQTGVTESVDRFGPAGTIDHALLIINGRCAPDAGSSLSQLQYQVERAFGRILGLSWSQLNDNVFSGTSTTTADQIANWPIMHPIDVICGLYTYLCITSPWTLRSDDRSALMQLYPVTPANLTAGKVLSTSNTFKVSASFQFPTGQGVDLVNVTVRRQPIGLSEVQPYEVASGVSGMLYRQAFPQPITVGVAAAENSGTTYAPAQALMSMPYIEVDNGATLYMTTEAINTLYTGDYAIGPYVRPTLKPSGSVQEFVNYFARPGAEQDYTIQFSDAAASCNPGADGTEGSPAVPDPSGWWPGLLCSVGHSSWFTATVKGGRSWTVEVDALDESGTLTVTKAQPLLGIWKSADPAGTLPTVAHTDASMDNFVPGATHIRMPITPSDASFRVAIADQFGGGRPDFAYRARILAADGVTPTVLAVGGGQIFISGRGFTQNMQVSVNGAAASVLSATPTQLIVSVPTVAQAKGTSGAALPVTVTDSATKGTSTIIDAVRYSLIATNLVTLVSAPATLETGAGASTPIVFKVLAADGITVVAGASVRVAVVSGSATLTACGTASSCTLTSDGTGKVQTSITGQAAGPVVVTATELGGGATASAKMTDADPMRSVRFTQPATTVFAGTAGSWDLTILATQDGVAAAQTPVTWSVSGGLVLQLAAAATDSSGQASALVQTNGVAAGTAPTVTACLWTTVCTSWQLTVVAPVRSVSLAPPSVTVTAATAASWSLTLTAVQNGAPGIGVPVTWSAGPGLTVLGSSPGTDANGQATAVVKTSGLPAGTVGTVTGCAWGNVCATWQVTAVAPARSVSIVQAPAFVFSQTPFSGNLTLLAVQDGLPAKGAPVVWTATGNVQVQPAGGSTDGNGQAGATVTTAGIASGAVATVTACAWGTVCTAWQVTAVDPGRTAVIANPTHYVAAGAPTNWSVVLTAVQQGQPTAGVPVSWTASDGLVLTGAAGYTGVAGQASVSVSTVGLAAGVAGSVTGCVWDSTCSTWQVIGVDPAQWTITAISGAGQSVTASQALDAVIFQLTDGAGHFVENAAVTIYQTDDAWEGSCAEGGRCASAPVLQTSEISLTTDGGGLLSVAPLQVPGQPQVVNLAAVTGVSGFAAISLPVSP